MLLVNWCFEPSQSVGIISGLKETLIKTYIVERTNKAEIRPEEQSEKMESYREDLWNEIHLKGPQKQKETQEQNKEWASAQLVYVKGVNLNIPTAGRQARGD